jgi:hypothetical protein
MGSVASVDGIRIDYDIACSGPIIVLEAQIPDR